MLLFDGLKPFAKIYVLCKLVVKKCEAFLSSYYNSQRCYQHVTKQEYSRITNKAQYRKLLNQVSKLKEKIYQPKTETQYFMSLSSPANGRQCY